MLDRYGRSSRTLREPGQQYNDLADVALPQICLPVLSARGPLREAGNLHDDLEVGRSVTGEDGPTCAVSHGETQVNFLHQHAPDRGDFTRNPPSW
jgi:hypothetical protein